MLALPGKRSLAVVGSAMMAVPWPESPAVRLLNAAALGALAVALLDSATACFHGALPAPGWLDGLLLLPSSFGALLLLVAGPALLVSLVLGRLEARLDSVLASARVHLILTCLGAAVALAGLFAIGSLPGRRLGLGWEAGLILVTILSGGLLLQRLGRRLLGDRAGPPQGLLLLGVAGVLVVVGLGLTQMRPSLRVHLLRRTPATATVLTVWQSLTDLDGDGYGGLFSGPDCAPFDSRVHPGAFDRPGNEEDEDCVGGDAATAEVAHVRAAPATPSGAFSGRSLVLVTVESLRADRIGAGGARRLVTPALDLLVGRSTFFGRAYANSSERSAAIGSLLTGRYPAPTRPALGARASSGAPAQEESTPASIAETVSTLAELLASAGYEAMAVLSTAGQEADSSMIRGFTRLQEVEGTEATRAQVTADLAVQEAAALADEFQGRRYLLWLHLSDPSPPFVFHGGTPFFGNTESDRYDGEVAFADAQIGMLLDRLDRSGQLESTVVVVVGTQGVSFGPMRAAGLGEGILRVPLIFWLPGIPAKRLSARVEGVDVTPTLLDLLGIEAPAGLSGQSLVPLMFNDEQARRRPDVFAEDSSGSRHRRALIHGDLKLIEDHLHGTVELYNLAEDPEERHDLAWGVPELQQLRRRLSAAGGRRHTPPPSD